MDRWSRLSRRFGTLRWQLTFSYFMTALVALLLLEGVFVGIPSFNALINPPAFHPVLLAQGLEKLAPQVAPYVARIHPTALVSQPGYVPLKTRWPHMPQVWGWIKKAHSR